MSTPATKALVDKLLTNVSNAYIPEGFISELVLPKLTVKQSTGKIGKYSSSHLRIFDDLIGGRAEAKRVDPIVRDSSLYNVTNHALEGVVTQDDYRNVEEPFNAESDETIGLTTMIQLNKERALSSVLTDPAVITQNVALSGTSQFDDYANSDPLGVFKDAQNAILDGCGMMPNKAVISQKVFNTLQYHPQILRTLGFADNRAGLLSIEEISKAMNIETLHIGTVSYLNNNEGQSLAAPLSQLWGNDIVFMHAPKAAAKYQVSLGYYVTFVEGRKVYKYPLNNPPESYGIIVQDNYSFELVNPNAAYLIEDAI